MSGWAFVFMVIGVCDVAAWLLRLIDMVDRPRRRRARR